MTRTMGLATKVIAAIMAAGCAVELPSSVDEGAAGEPRHASEMLVSTLEPANVLIFGDLITHVNVLRVRLQALGHTVTIRPGFGLPSTVEELAQFQTVWHVGRNVPLTPAQQALLAEYLSLGGAVHLTGEGEGADASNEALTTFVRSVVKHGNGIRIGNPDSVPGPDDGTSYPVAENAPGNVASSPNTVMAVEMLGVGGITGLPVPSPSALVIGGLHGERAVGAIWDSEDLEAEAGKLSILMDADWLLRSNGANDNLTLIQNLQEYLIGEPIAN